MKQKASEIYSWIQDAVSDVAQGNLFPKEDWNKIEIEADRLFNDVDTIRDLIGDQIYSAVGGSIDDNQEKAFELCIWLKHFGHKAVMDAVDKFMEDYDLVTPRNLFVKLLKDEKVFDKYKKAFSESDWNDGDDIEKFIRSNNPFDLLNLAFDWSMGTDSDKDYDFWFQINNKWDAICEEYGI